MMEIIPPYETDAFNESNAIEQAIMLKDFLGFLERLTNDTSERLATCLKDAAEQNLETPDYYVQVRYREGKSFSPDAELLLANFPEKYKAWKDAQIAKFKPKLTKTDFERLWTTEGSTRAEKKASKEKNLEEMKKCMVEHPVTTQYLLSSVAEREAWKAAHPKEDD